MADEVSSKMNSLSLSETKPSSSSSSSLMISLLTIDGKTYQVELLVAKEMETIQSFFDATDDPTTTIPLPNVRDKELRKIIEYCKKSVAGEITKEFETEFVKDLDNEQAKDLLLAANYLNTPKLFDYMTQVIADRIKNRSVEYVRGFFGVENDFTPEEEAKLHEELVWTFRGVEED